MGYMLMLCALCIYMCSIHSKDTTTRNYIHGRIATTLFHLYHNQWTCCMSVSMAIHICIYAYKHVQIRRAIYGEIMVCAVAHGAL